MQASGCFKMKVLHTHTHTCTGSGIPLCSLGDISSANKNPRVKTPLSLIQLQHTWQHNTHFFFFFLIWTHSCTQSASHKTLACHSPKLTSAVCWLLNFGTFAVLRLKKACDRTLTAHKPDLLLLMLVGTTRRKLS